MTDRILLNEFKALSKEPWVKVELENENIKEWNVVLFVLHKDSPYHGGYFKATMTFPDNYPYDPPSFKFARPLFHPNIYPDGSLCISILHPPGEDEMSGELAAERWSPAQRVETVLMSILSLLDDAEVSSPANVDAGIMLRTDEAAYSERVRQDVEASKSDVPEGFIMPRLPDEGKFKCHSDDADFWAESGDDDFGGSDSDQEMTEVEDQSDDDGDTDESDDESDKSNVSAVDVRIA